MQGEEGRTLKIHIVVEITKTERKELDFEKRDVRVPEIKERANLPLDVHLAIVDGDEAEEVANDETVTIKEGERFAVIQRSLKVNTRDKPWPEPTISFRQVSELAFGPYDERMDYTITYSRGPRRNPKGTMTDGKSVHVKAGMVFDVTRTNKS